MNSKVLITFLSWEDRYIEGLEKDIKRSNPSLTIVFKYTTNSDWKKENLMKTEALLKDQLEIVEIDNLKPDKAWFIFKEVFSRFCKGKDIVLNITTMPREAIWLSLYNCKLNQCKTEYIYYKPLSYSDTWISRDPGQPRLLYKMSGIAKLGAPTLLLVTGGYDIQRLDSLIYNFEAKETMLFYQKGDSERNLKNFEECKSLFKAKYNLDLHYNYDAYDVIESYNLIVKKLNLLEERSQKKYLDNYNVILNSLGAKTSAITLFKIWLKYPNVALSYIPSKEYNKDYSKGLGEAYFGEIF